MPLEYPFPSTLERAAALNARFKGKAAQDVVAYALSALEIGRVALVSSFGAESVVLLHMVAEVDASAPVLFIDTEMLFAETRLPWVAPSPNLPTAESALVYPGQVLLEGTSLSEGRGTTRPFEICGAPWIEPEKLSQALARFRLPGVTFRPLFFEPTFQKWSGTVCGGVHLHVTDPAAYRSCRASITLLREVIRLWPRRFAWRRPPYEYERKRPPFDILAGDPRIRQSLAGGRPPGEILALHRSAIDRFSRAAEDYFLYS